MRLRDSERKGPRYARAERLKLSPSAVGVLTVSGRFPPCPLSLLAIPVRSQRMRWRPVRLTRALPQTLRLIMSVRAALVGPGRLLVSRGRFVSSRAGRRLPLLRRVRGRPALHSEVRPVLAQLIEVLPDPLVALARSSRPTRTLRLKSLNNLSNLV